MYMVCIEQNRSEMVNIIHCNTKIIYIIAIEYMSVTLLVLCAQVMCAGRRCSRHSVPLVKLYPRPMVMIIQLSQVLLVYIDKCHHKQMKLISFVKGEHIQKETTGDLKQSPVV